MMKTVCNFIFIVVFVLCAGFINDIEAQPKGIDAFSNTNDLGSGGAMFRSFDNRFKGIEGSQLFFDSYREGLVQLKSGKWYKIDSVNYDTYYDELLIKKNSDAMIVSTAMVLRFVIVGVSDSIIFISMKHPLTNKIGFARVLVEGKKKLLVKDVRDISAPTNTGAYSLGTHSSKFVDKKSYFFGNDYNSLVEIKNKKYFLNEMQGDRDVIDNYIKENKIKFEKEGDLIRLIYFINTL